MLRYTLKRLLSLIISLIIASFVIFFVIEIAPGDPASFMLGINAQPETLSALKEELGLILEHLTPIAPLSTKWLLIECGYRFLWLFMLF